MDALSNGYIQPFIKQLNSRWPCIRFVRRIDQIHFGDTLSIIAKKDLPALRFMISTAMEDRSNLSIFSFEKKEFSFITDRSRILLKTDTIILKFGIKSLQHPFKSHCG